MPLQQYIFRGLGCSDLSYLLSRVKEQDRTLSQEVKVQLRAKGHGAVQNGFSQFRFVLKSLTCHRPPIKACDATEKKAMIDELIGYGGRWHQRSVVLLVKEP